MDLAAALEHADRAWDDHILPALHDYIRIPNVSPAYAPDWAEAGHMDQAIALLAGWAEQRAIAGLTVGVERLEGRTPLLFMEIPAFRGSESTGDDGEPSTVLLYGHLDKQPEMIGWREGLGPWEPVLEGDRLYGRGGADDGYSTFAALTAIEAVQAAGESHGRCIVIIEASEESGSPDLPAYIEALANRIGRPDLIVCLDSGCGTYEHLWVSTSLRGLFSVELTVEILEEGVHSGGAGGVVPSTSRILRQLLSRIEDENTGEMLVPELYVDIPADRLAQARATADELGDEAGGGWPLVPGGRTVVDDPVELILNRTWRPTLATVGMAGIPDPGQAGNVLRPSTTVKLSIRVPPTADSEAAAKAVHDRLVADPPYGARITCKVSEAATGWNAPTLSTWLAQTLDDASHTLFGDGARFHGEGGTIPFMAMLGERFPLAQFLVTGLLGPGSNAHGPNEFLHVPTGKRLTAAVAGVLVAQEANRPQDSPA